MAVYIPENTKCSIEFVYETPGLSTGILISVLSAAAFAVYIQINKKEEIITFGGF